MNCESRARGPSSWRRIVAVYIGVQFAEIFGVSMIYSYLPLALEVAGVPIGDIASLTGIAIAGLFVIGAPQVPIWLAIAELRSRRLVIVRSGLIALAALIAFAVADQAWQLVAATVALGFWLGNTGVMLATIREVAPARERARAISLFQCRCADGLRCRTAPCGMADRRSRSDTRRTDHRCSAVERCAYRCKCCCDS